MTGESAGADDSVPRVSSRETRGRTTITSRAITTVGSIVAAEALGVTARQVRLELSDRAGSLAVVANSPISAAPLDRVGSVAPGPTILERAASAQASIRERMTDLTGSQVDFVRVHLTGIDVAEQGRVQ